MVALTNQYLVEFDTIDDTLGTVTERFCTGEKFITKKSETPSLAKYLPLLINVGSVEDFLFDKNKTTGTVSNSSGRVELNNGSSRLDYLLDRGMDGQVLTIRERTGDNYPADFPVRFQGIIEGVSFNTRKIQIDIKSLTFRVLQEVYQPIKYAGTNDGSTIFLEGTEDLEGEAKPKLVGDGSNGNIPAVLVDRANEIYQLSSDPAVIDNVYVGRAVITAGTKYSTLSAFIAAVTTTPPTAGTYDYYEGDYTFDEGDNERGVYIALGTTPTLAVTFDATEGWYNQILQTEDFSTTWSRSGITVTTDDAIAPDGETTADKAEKGASSFRRVNQTISLTGTVGDYYTFSVFVKAGTLDTISLNATGSVVRAWVDFNFVDGITSTITNNLADSSKLNPTIEVLDNGWYRVSLTFDTDQASNTFRIYVGGAADSTAGYVYLWGAQVERYEKAGPYVAVTTTPIINNQAASNVWKVMDARGHVLDSGSVADANSDNSALTYVSVVSGEEKLKSILDLLANSIKAYITDTVDGRYHIGVFKVPTVGELVKVIDNSLLLGDPKRKIIRSNDAGRGIPIYRATANWGKNGLVMNENAIAGSALNDIPFVSKEFRKSFNETAATKTKHVDALEVTFDTALTQQSDANARSLQELDLYDTIRLLIEIKVPQSVGVDLNNNDVIQVGSRIYRIVGKITKFPSVSGANAITFQAWGGVTV